MNLSSALAEITQSRYASKWGAIFGPHASQGMAVWTCAKSGMTRSKNNTPNVLWMSDLMVSQANFFKDDISGALFQTPIEAMESERKSEAWLAELFFKEG